MPHTQINLLPEGKVAKITSNPILTWYSKIGMYVLLVIYVLAVGGLVYRWYFDQQLADVNAEIKDKVEQVSEKSDFIKNYVSLQKTFAALQSVDDLDKIPMADYLRFIKSTIPEPISIDSVSLSGVTLNISAVSTDYGAINQWYRFFETSRLLIADSKYVDSLDKSELPDELRVDIANKGFELDPNAEVKSIEPNRWEIADSRHKFALKLEDDGINVSIDPPLFKSIQLNRVERNLDDEENAGLIKFDFSISM